MAYLEGNAVSLALVLGCREVSNFAPHASCHDTMPRHRFRGRQATWLPLHLLLQELKQQAANEGGTEQSWGEPTVPFLKDGDPRYNSICEGMGRSSLLKVLLNICGQTHSLMTEDGYRTGYCPRTCRETKDISSFHLGIGGDGYP